MTPELLAVGVVDAQAGRHRARADPRSRRSLAARRRGATGVRGRLVGWLGPDSRPGAARPRDDRTPKSWPLRRSGSGYRRDRVVFDTEATMSVPAYLLVPDDRTEPGPAVLAIHGHGPGKSQVCGLDPGSDDPDDRHRPTATTPTSWRAGATSCWRPDLRCFGERLDWNPPDHYACDTNLVHAVMAGESPLAANLWDLSRALDVLEAPPARRPDAHGRGRAVLRRHLHALPGRHRRAGRGRGGQRLLLVVGRDPQDAVEHVRLAGAARHARPPRARRPRRAHRAPAAAGRVGHRRRPLPRRRGPAHGGRAVPRCTTHLGAPDDALAHDVFDGGHQWHGDRAYPFLERWLGTPD